MVQREKHVEYVKRTMKIRDILYHITEQDRMATLFWAVNSLKMLKDPMFDQIKPQAIQFVFSCLKPSGGFGPNAEYSENIVSTFNALQVLYLYNVPYYDSKTVEFILSLQQPSGAFAFDRYGDVDTRLDCCAILSLHLLSIMREGSHFDAERAQLISSRLSGLPDIFQEGERDADVCDEGIKEVLHDISPEVLDVKLDRSRLSTPIDPSFLAEIGFDVDITLYHLLGCVNYDGGVGQLRGSESHAAQVFCVLSSLRSLGSLDAIDRLKTVDFLVYRQQPSGGLCGRVNKKEDVCYSFWAYSSLVMLNAEYIDVAKLKAFVLSCEDEDGGFSDRPRNEPDLFHLMFSLASLSLMKAEGLESVDPGFAI